MNFAVSTTAFRGKSIEAILSFADQHSLQIEFSSGLPFREDMESIFLNAKCKRLPHNYFPAPKEPFVLNLGSLNSEIFKKSIDHCIRGLQLASQAKAPFFSVHAGFCLDPSPQLLGRPFDLSPQHPRKDHWAKFIEGVRVLVPEAEKLGVLLLIENNVLAPFNLKPGQENPLLCADPDELEALMNEIASPHVALLIDTGHLKVSAQTLGFSPDQALIRVSKWVKAFHHSDNTGTEDTNHPVEKNYWFLAHASQFKNATHILEVHDQTIENIQYQFELIARAS